MSPVTEHSPKYKCLIIQPAKVLHSFRSPVASATSCNSAIVISRRSVLNWHHIMVSFYSIFRNVNFVFIGDHTCPSTDVKMYSKYASFIECSVLLNILLLRSLQTFQTMGAMRVCGFGPLCRETQSCSHVLVTLALWGEGAGLQSVHRSQSDRTESHRSVMCSIVSSSFPHRVQMLGPTHPRL